MTPLSGIVLWCEMLARKADLPPVVERGLTAIDRSARAQVAILDNLVELSHLEAGSAELHRSRVNVVSCVSDVLVRNASASKQRQVTLRFERPPDDSFIEGDPIRLRTALHNLVDNALTRSPPGGRVDVALEKTAQGISIHITDEGSDIAADALPKLFTLGELTETGLAGRPGSLGLGLPIAHWIIGVHGGRILVVPRRVPRLLLHDRAARSLTGARLFWGRAPLKVA